LSTPHSGDIKKSKTATPAILIPSGRARRATANNKAEFEAAGVEPKAAAAKLAESQAQGRATGRLPLPLTKAGVDGRLFGSVTNADIAIELTASSGCQIPGVRLPRSVEDRGRAPGQRRAAQLTSLLKSLWLSTAKPLNCLVIQRKLPGAVL
jgi:ribosomal protein L9